MVSDALSMQIRASSRKHCVGICIISISSNRQFLSTSSGRLRGDSGWRSVDAVYWQKERFLGGGIISGHQFVIYESLVALRKVALGEALRKVSTSEVSSLIRRWQTKASRVGAKKCSLQLVTMLLNFQTSV